MPLQNHYVATTGATIAYKKSDATGTTKTQPGVVFLGGFRSDMTGTKALYLQDWAKQRGMGFLRFDYRGHGASSGAFEDGCISDWVADAEAIISAMTSGPQILVGSSMGGWIALRLAQLGAFEIAGIVGIATAPDFTEDGMWAAFSAAEKKTLAETGQLAVPSAYSDAPYVITAKLIEDGRENLVLRAPLNLPCPVRLLHGTGDVDVPQSVPLRLLDHARCPDLRLTLVKDADHRFSGSEELAMIGRAIDEITGRVG